MDPFNKVPHILTEQDADPVLLNFKRQMHGLPFDEQILALNPRYIHYCRNKKHNRIEIDILYRQYYNDVVDINELQVLFPVQLKDTLRKSLHGQAGKHPGISKMMQEYRQKNYFPSIANHVRKWAKKSQTSVQYKRIDNTQFETELIKIPERD